MTQSVHLSRAAALRAGLNEEGTRSFISKQMQFRAAGTRELYTLKHLALSANVEQEFLGAVIRRSNEPYEAIEIPKATGGHRSLFAPSDQLKQVQRWILDNVLTGHSPRHPSSFAYEPGVTTLECAQQHIGARWMVKTDVHNFFPSISEKAVYGTFRRLKYTPLLAYEMARLCTWPSEATGNGGPRNMRSESASLPYLEGPPGVLPQGAPTSGALANAVMRPLDETLTDIAIRQGFVYTRYSDDIAFSSSSQFSRLLGSELIAEVRRAMVSRGLALHQKKTKIIPPGSRMLLLGMAIGPTRVEILPEHRRRIRLYIHCVGRYGVASFAKKRGFDSGISFINHVYGWFSYLSQIDPDWVHSKKLQWEQVLEQHEIYPESLK